MDDYDGTVCNETDRDPPEPPEIEYTCPGCKERTTESHYLIVENGHIEHR